MRILARTLQFFTGTAWWSTTSMMSMKARHHLDRRVESFLMKELQRMAKPSALCFLDSLSEPPTDTGDSHNETWKIHGTCAVSYMMMCCTSLHIKTNMVSFAFICFQTCLSPSFVGFALLFSCLYPSFFFFFAKLLSFTCLCSSCFVMGELGPYIYTQQIGQEMTFVGPFLIYSVQLKRNDSCTLV